MRCPPLYSDQYNCRRLGSCRRSTRTASPCPSFLSLRPFRGRGAAEVAQRAGGAVHTGRFRRRNATRLSSASSATVWGTGQRSKAILSFLSSKRGAFPVLPARTSNFADCVRVEMCWVVPAARRWTSRTNGAYCPASCHRSGARCRTRTDPAAQAPGRTALSQKNIARCQSTVVSTWYVFLQRNNIVG